VLQDASQSQKHTPEKQALVTRSSLASGQHKERYQLGMKDASQYLGLLVGEAEFFRDVIQEVIESDAERRRIPAPAPHQS
jgi:hypothetical protein